MRHNDWGTAKNNSQDVVRIGWIGKVGLWFCERLMVAKVVRLHHKYV